MSTPSAPRLWWGDEGDYNIMFYSGNKIEFNLFPTMFEAMEKDLIELWEKRILHCRG